jgi:peptidoglycan/LPS O-acetylase OafA/YrhL
VISRRIELGKRTGVSLRILLKGLCEMTNSAAATPTLDSTLKAGTIGRNNFDFCRFWLAVMVIFSHSFALVEGDERNEPLGKLTNFQIGSGSFAVSCFFAISGFLITHSWLRSSSAANFLTKRILRIYPGFVVAVLVGLFIVAPIATEHFRLTTQNLMKLPIYLIALRPTEPLGAFPGNPVSGAINGSLWTIPYEFKCYLGLMFMGVLGFLGRYRGATIVLLILTVMAGVCYPMMIVPDFERGAFAAIIGMASSWANILPYFIAGTTFYLFRDQIPYNRVSILCTTICLIGASVFPPVGKIVFPFGITYMLFGFTLHSSIRFDHWAKYGDFSYGIYLYAYPIQQLVVMRIPEISPVSLFLVATPFSIIAGAMSWHLIEKHFMRMKPRPKQQLVS